MRPRKSLSGHIVKVAVSALVALCLLSGQAFAGGPAPNLLIDWEVDGDGSGQWTPIGSDNGNGTYDYDNTTTFGTDSHEIEWDLTVNPDPFVSAGFAVTNNSLVTQTFIITTTLPIFPVTPASLMGGSTQGGVTDANFDGVGTLATDGVTGAPMYEGLIDGVGVLSLLPHASSVTVPFAGGSNSTSASAGLPGPTIPGPAALVTIGIRHTFTLTPGDRASFTSFFVVEPIPLPTGAGMGMAALVAVGVVGRIRRRSR